MNKHLKKSVTWAMRNKISIILTFIIILGAFLRLNEFSDLARFNADQVRDARIVDQMAAGEDFPLLGPKAGGTTFKLGPAFYYLQYLSGAIFGFSPEGISYLIPLFSIASIFLFFLFFKKFFSINNALLLTLLYSSSFYVIKYSKFAWNPNFIPFFLISFLLLASVIMAKNAKLYHHLLFALVIGIGIQLHTTLLIALPITTLIVYFFTFKKNIQHEYKIIAAVFFLVFALNLPSIFYDIQNRGENIKAFFVGASTKTHSSSAFKNIANTFSIAFQGTAYTLTGQDPQKDWTKPVKLIKSKAYGEISTAIIGSLLFIFGSTLLFLKIKRKEKNYQDYLLVSFFSVTIFFLFIIIGEELNVRFFISIIFLPFLFIGLIFEWLLKKSKLPYSIILITITIFALLFGNIYKYSQAYNLDNYQTNDSVYGGISLKESRELSNFIKFEMEKYPDSKQRNLEFEFEKSIDYFNEKQNIHVKKYSDNEVVEKQIVYLMVEKEKLENSLKKIAPDFDLLNQKTAGRFVIVSLQPKNVVHKIGFITDIHAKLKKDLTLAIEEQNTLNYFINQMNSVFKPDFVVQNGDFIDGTRRMGQKSINDIEYLNKNFSQLSMPFYNVLGNHDLRGLTVGQWLELTKSKNIYYDFKHENLSVIVLSGNDTYDNDNDTYELSEEQFTWLEDSLRTNPDSRKIVFLHYPIVTKNMQPGDRTITPEAANRLKNIFTDNKVLATFSGHIEKLEMNEENGTRYFVIPGMERSKNKSVQWYDSFAEITVKNKVEVDFYYKKDRTQQTYQKLKIPSQEFTNIEK